ncbi:hypothetical protein AB4X15_03100 [Peribacillus simplex]|uniref:hypothetical protein n=1 Tax=Peribacillus simplex TaxID=1478 RepID=UPI0034E88075
MAKDFELDLGPLRKLIAKSPDAAGRGAKQAMDDIKDDWVRGARDIAPLDTGNLRRQITGEVEGNGPNTKVIVTANAAQKGFNYGYYIHEFDAGGRKLRTPGTVKKFLDESADEAKWQQWLEEEIADELKKAGW